ncbi:MAG: cytochrome c maturation protein CcmE [Desulfovibrionaceae bacterium]|jgi:cytochrome c-type biogenesis protein CcmE|nr:cytochrome c maturation protein CcmE [Desulfovibrionaceae bacterium]
MSSAPAATATPAWTPRQRRLLLVVVALLLGGIALAAVLFAFKDNLEFNLTPADVAAGKAQGKGNLRIGGLVEKGSFRRVAGQELEVRFALTDIDMVHSVPVVYHGVLPDLFAEGKGAIARGRLDANGQLIASEVLAKHDENYMPPGLEQRPASQASGR